MNFSLSKKCEPMYNEWENGLIISTLVLHGIISYMFLYNISICYKYLISIYINSTLPPVILKSLELIWQYKFLIVACIIIFDIIIYAISNIEYLKSYRFLPIIIYISIINLLFFLVLVDFLQIQSYPYGRLI